MSNAATEPAGYVYLDEFSGNPDDVLDMQPVQGGVRVVGDVTVPTEDAPKVALDLLTAAGINGDAEGRLGYAYRVLVNLTKDEG